MSRQPLPPARRRPMAIRVPAADGVTPRPVLRVRWSWLVLAALFLSLATVLTLVVVR